MADKPILGWRTQEHPYQQEVTSLTDGQAVTLDARGLSRLTIEAGALATVTLSRVDSATATAHTAQTETVNADSRSVIDVDWPFYRIDTAGGPARIAMV